MDKKPSASAEVEALRTRLKEMGRARTLELAKKAHLAGPTIDKFRRGHITDLRADKYAALTAVLAEEAA